MLRVVGAVVEGSVDGRVTVISKGIGSFVGGKSLWSVPMIAET